jgi:tetratricopeptide (TPR) repeat protein
MDANPLLRTRFTRGTLGAVPLRIAAVWAIVVAALAVSVAPAHARPNLKAQAKSQPPKQLVPGKKFTIRDKVRNAGTRAGKSETRFYLTANPKRSKRDRAESTTDPRTSPADLLLLGSRGVPALGRGKSSSGSTRVTVPAGIGPGKWFLLACADDHGMVRESREQDNCKAAKRAVVAAAPAREARIDAFSDTTQPLPPAVEQSRIDLIRIQHCGTEQQDLKDLTLKRALARAKRQLTQGAGADAMSQFRASVAYRSAGAAQEAAGQAVMAGAPAAALAALLRAHELQPHEASHLINAAGIASTIGMPNEAIALLDAAVALDDRDRTPMGISRQAIAATSRGTALVHLGRFADAQRAYEAAVALEPLMQEAYTGLAIAQTCRASDGEDPLPAFRRGRSRQGQTARQPGQPGSGGDPENPSVMPPIDDSQGELFDLRNVPFPPKPVDAPQFDDYYEQFQRDELSWTIEVSQREQALLQQMRAQPVQPATARRRDELLYLSRVVVGQAGELEQLRQQMVDEIALATQARRPLFADGENEGEYGRFADEARAECDGSGDPECFDREMRERCVPRANVVHNEVVNALGRAHDTARVYFTERSRRASAIAAHLKEPAAYQVALLNIARQDAVLVSALTAEAHFWVHVLDNHADHCVGADPPQQPPDAVGPPAVPGGTPCPPELKAISFALTLGPISVNGNCDEITVGGATPGWIGAFGEVTYGRDGSVTVIAGARTGVGLGPAGAEVRAGIYVRSDATGIQDVGARVGSSVSVSAGPLQYGSSGSSDLSFVGAFSST